MVSSCRALRVEDRCPYCTDKLQADLIGVVGLQMSSETSIHQVAQVAAWATERDLWQVRVLKPHSVRRQWPCRWRKPSWLRHQVQRRRVMETSARTLEQQTCSGTGWTSLKR